MSPLTRVDRMKWRWIDTVTAIGFPVRASWHILSAIAKSLESLGKRDSQYMWVAWTELLDGSKDIVQSADGLVSGLIWTTREAIWAVLEGKSRAIDKLNLSPKKAKSIFGKTRRHLTNRVLNLIDAIVNTAGWVAIWWLDLVDVTFAKWTDIVTERRSPRADNYKEKVWSILYNTLIDEPLVQWVWNSWVKGKSRKARWKNFAYLRHTRNKRS